MRASRFARAIVAGLLVLVSASAGAEQLFSFSTISSSGRPLTIDFNLDLQQFTWLPFSIGIPLHIGDPPTYITKGFATNLNGFTAFKVVESDGDSWTATNAGPSSLELTSISGESHSEMHLALSSSVNEMYYTEYSRLELNYTCDGSRSACSYLWDEYMWSHPAAFTNPQPASGAAFTSWTVPASAHNPYGDHGEHLVTFSVVPEPSNSAMMLFGILLLTGSALSCARAFDACGKRGRVTRRAARDWMYGVTLPTMPNAMRGTFARHATSA